MHIFLTLKINLQICGLTVEELDSIKVKCEHCNGMLRKASYPSHVQGFCPALRQKEQDLVLELKKEVEPQEIVYSETGRIKRNRKQKRSAAFSVK